MKTSQITAILIGLGVNAFVTSAPESAWAAAAACSKKFKSALVLAGGGVTPGMALGMIAGARAAGHKPDVIITTCGASISGAIANAFPDPAQAKAYVTSKEFHQFLLREVKVGKTSPADLGLKLGKATFTPGLIPDAFDKNVMSMRPTMSRILQRENFTTNAGESRLITVAARATYKPEHAGLAAEGQTLYEQTYFTDKDTGRALRNLPASMKKNFPESPIHPWTAVKTGVSTVQAARASISDPYLLNPAKIGNEYYFAGAMDLFPIETAKAIACDVTSTAPSGKYSFLEDMAVKRGFGFSQQERADQLRKYRGVNWIRTVGANKYAMDPDVEDMEMVNKIPRRYEDFKKLIEKQYEFGFQRAMAAYSSEAPAAQSVQRRARVAR